MAQHQIGNLESDGIVSRARAVSGSAAVSTAVYATPSNYTSPTALDTRLAAINGTIYTSAVLDKMTINDKVYAVRLNDDSGTV